MLDYMDKSLQYESSMLLFCMGQNMQYMGCVHISFIKQFLLTIRESGEAALCLLITCGRVLNVRWFLLICYEINHFL